MKRIFLIVLLCLVACQQNIPTGAVPPADEQPADEQPADPDTPQTPGSPELPLPDAPPPTAHNALWSDPATWGGELPRSGADVVILPEQKILLDVSPPDLGSPENCRLPYF